jgi:hypothetical protein
MYTKRLETIVAGLNQSVPCKHIQVYYITHYKLSLITLEELEVHQCKHLLKKLVARQRSSLPNACIAAVWMTRLPLILQCAFYSSPVIWRDSNAMPH